MSVASVQRRGQCCFEERCLNVKFTGSQISHSFCPNLLLLKSDAKLFFLHLRN